MDKEIQNTVSLKSWIETIKNKILEAQTRASFKVNAEMLQLYWEIGNSILEVQNTDGWGAQVIDKLSKELKIKFPDSTGFSVRNLKYMRSFAKEYPGFPFVQVPLAQISWYHHITLLSKVKELRKRVFYIIQTAQNEWSSDVMLLQIKSNLYNNCFCVNTFSV